MMMPQTNEPTVEQLLTRLEDLQKCLDFLPERFAALLQDPATQRKGRNHGYLVGDNGVQPSKDILHEDQSLDFVGSRTLSPEGQIQRLTAQLTAAYNRIAALEEQLIHKRNFV